MITSEKALEIILNHSKKFGEEEIDFINSLGRVLNENIVADRDFPPFNRVSMDGIAIVFSEFERGRRTFAIENIQAAGAAQKRLQNKENCIEVMTGSILPKNVDTVIPYELVEIKEGKATTKVAQLNYNQNVHNQAKDKKMKDLLISSGTLISSAEIGVLATVGKYKIKVAKNPKVMIISTGDELVDINEIPLPYQIRRSNSYTLASLLARVHIKASITHITDDKLVLKQKIKQLLKDYDVLLFSGAVSKGKYDFLPEIFEELEVEKLFHKVKQRPGKPFWFGVKKKGKTSLGTVVFAFPGNPVSTFVGCVKYFYPWIKKSLNLAYINQQKAILSQDYTFKPALTYFLQVKVENKKGVLYATPIAGNGSGDLANLIFATAFLELPNNRTNFKKGEVFPVIEYR